MSTAAEEVTNKAAATPLLLPELLTSVLEFSTFAEVHAVPRCVSREWRAAVRCAVTRGRWKPVKFVADQGEATNRFDDHPHASQHGACTSNHCHPDCGIIYGVKGAIDVEPATPAPVPRVPSYLQQVQPHFSQARIRRLPLAGMDRRAVGRRRHKQALRQRGRHLGGVPRWLLRWL